MRYSLIVAASLWAQSVAGAPNALLPTPLGAAEQNDLLQRQEARCRVEIRRGQTLLVLVVNGSQALVRLDGALRELSMLEREVSDGAFVIRFADPLARYELQLRAKRQGDCVGTAECQRYAASLRTAGPDSYQQERWPGQMEGLAAEEFCTNRQLDRLFYQPSLIERIFRAWTA